MKQQVADQLNRVKNSVLRLTQNTPLQGTTVSLGEPTGEDRLNFCTLTPSGDQLIDCYQGVLLDALEGWTDGSLDWRMYKASDIMVRHLLNRPIGMEAADQEEEEMTGSPTSFVSRAGGQRTSRGSGCLQCLQLRLEIQDRLLQLEETTRRGTSISRNRCRSGVGEYIDLLTGHLHMQRELHLLRRSLAFHVQNHFLQKRCRRLEKSDN